MDFRAAGAGALSALFRRRRAPVRGVAGRRDAVRQRLWGFRRLARSAATLQNRPAERAGESGDAGVTETGGRRVAGTDAGIGFRLGPDRRRLALSREMIADRRFAEALALGVGAEHLWLRPPLWDGRIYLPELDDAELRLLMAEYEEYAIDDQPRATA